MFTLVDYRYKDLYNKQHVDKQMKIVAVDFTGYGQPPEEKEEYIGAIYKDLETGNYYIEERVNPYQVEWKKIEENSCLVFSNKDIQWESFELEESLCSDSELRFGSCEASSLKIRIHNNFIPMKGKCLIISETLEGKTDAPFQFGIYKVDSDKPTADRKYREITAYDAMYDILNADASTWYNTILPNDDSTVTLGQFRKSFVEYFGLKENPPIFGYDENGNAIYGLINDNITIEKTIRVGENTEIDNGEKEVSMINESSLTGKDVITAICEINGCFGHIGRDGKFHYIYLKKDIMGLYPSDTLFPDHAPWYLKQSETGHLYPQSPESARIGNGAYKGCTYEDYLVRKIEKIQIRKEENDSGGEYGDGKNKYVIEGNFLAYGKNAGSLRYIARNILSEVKDVVYRPFSAECQGNPCLEVGDAVSLSTKYELIESYILKRTLKGIQSISDSYAAEGQEYFSENGNSVGSSIIALKGKTNLLFRDAGETRSEISRFEGETGERFEEVRTSIVQTAESITSTVSKATSKYDTSGYDVALFGYSGDPDIPYDASENNGAYYLNQSDGNLYQSNGISWIQKKKLNLISENLSSRIAQTIDTIDLSVENGEKQAGIKITLKKEGDEEATTKEAVGRIDMTGLVSFTNLENSGETVINGGNIKTDSIDASKIQVETLYVVDSLKIKHEGTMRTALSMKDVDGQEFPTLILGGEGRFANIETINDVYFNGANGIDCSKLFVRGESQFDKRINFSGSDIDLDKSGVTRGLKVINENGEHESILAMNANDRTTLVGRGATSSKNETVTLLRGNTVELASAGSVTPSDERLKNSFKPLDEFDSVYMDIEPCAFKYNNGTSGRYHFGAKAQDVKRAFESHGYTTQDFGGFVQMQDNPESEDYCGVEDPMGLIYTEFTMWNMHMVHELYKKVGKQQEEIDSLKESVSFLMERI